MHSMAGIPRTSIRLSAEEHRPGGKWTKLALDLVRSFLALSNCSITSVVDSDYNVVQRVVHHFPEYKSIDSDHIDCL